MSTTELAPINKDELMKNMGSKNLIAEDAVYLNDLTTLNLGPTHPATHGIFQNILQMDGEKIVSGEPTVGYIHRAFEKIAENRPYYQITTLTAVSYTHLTLPTNREV